MKPLLQGRIGRCRGLALCSDRHHATIAVPVTEIARSPRPAVTRSPYGDGNQGPRETVWTPCDWLVEADQDDQDDPLTVHRPARTPPLHSFDFGPDLRRCACDVGDPHEPADLVTCNAPMPDPPGNRDRLRTALPEVWRRADPDFFSRLWPALAPAVRSGGMAIVHAASAALLPALDDAPGERVVVTYMPDGVPGFAIAWWRPMHRRGWRPRTARSRPGHAFCQPSPSLRPGSAIPFNRQAAMFGDRAARPSDHEQGSP
jgi:hypothetical protein